MSWTHYDSQLEKTAQTVMGKLPSEWTPADLRGFVAYACSVIGEMRDTPTVTADHRQIVDLSSGGFFSPECEQLAKAILGGFLVLGAEPGTGKPRLLTSAIETSRPATPQAAGLEVWVIVVIAAAVGLASCAFIAREAAPLIDRGISREVSRQQLLQAQVELVKLAKAHADAEDKAGKPIPLNAAELAAIASLSKAADITLAKIKDEKPFESPPFFSLEMGAALAVLALVALYVSQRKTA